METVEILVKYLDESPILPSDPVERHRWLLGLIRVARKEGYEAGRCDGYHGNDSPSFD